MLGIKFLHVIFHPLEIVGRGSQYLLVTRSAFSLHMAHDSLSTFVQALRWCLYLSRCMLSFKYNKFFDI